MKFIEGLRPRYAILAGRTAYTGGNSVWERGDTYHKTITWAEGQAIAAALNAAAKDDIWIVREIKEGKNRGK